ncbi:MAG: hypothetical protein JKY53_02900 [Flavobacteriales bacterium]|nr:hypothetical protein [Flavobacteriales bacterium]
MIKYKNGNIKEKKVILDSNSYLVLKYFDDGVLKDSTPYINSKRNGIRRFYFRDEGYSNWVTYKNDTVNGLVWAKYIDETIYYTGEMKDSLRLGEWFFYHENGNLSEYEFLSRAGTSQYLREYDVEGIYLQHDGKALIEFIYMRDTILVDKPYYFEVTLATPPNCKTVFYSTDMKTNGEYSNVVDYGFESNPLVSSVKFNSPGEHVKKFGWAIEDTVTGEIEKGSLTELIFVK